MSTSLSETSAALPGRQLAPLGRRFAGQVIDWAITVVIIFAGAVGGGDAVGVTFTVAGIAYYLLSDGLPNGQSLAKRMLKMSVVDAASGKPCNYFQSFLRNIAQVLGILDWLWIFGEKRRRAGDLLARTLVVSV
jgi:uncharacterized RDD family membrane protein YckC